MMHPSETYKLVFPDETYSEAWHRAVDALRETDGKIIPANLDAPDFPSFLENVRNLAAGRGLPEGYVPSELYFLVREDAPGEILGVTDLRLDTTAAIEEYFGHAGGCILPRYRRMGLGTHIIRLSAQKLRQKGFSSFIVTCESWNTASRRAILANGGVFLGNSQLGEKTYERYRIRLDAE